MEISVLYTKIICYKLLLEKKQYDFFSAARKKGSQDIKGYRKLINYQNKLSDFESWKKRASPEDIEYQDIEIGKIYCYNSLTLFLEAQLSNNFSLKIAFVDGDTPRDLILEHL